MTTPKQNREWHRKHSVARSKYHRALFLKSKYGLTEAAYNTMLDAQGHACAICGEPDGVGGQVRGKGLSRLFVDHDHSTDAVRALLCQNCNTALGLLEDSPARLEAAAVYLRLHGSK